MQDQLDSEPQPNIASLNENGSGIDEQDIIDEIDLYDKEQLYDNQEDKENMSPPNYVDTIEENPNQPTHEGRQVLGQLDIPQQEDFIIQDDDEFIEEPEEYSTPVEETSQGTANQLPKPFNSLLLVQEYHTGLTSGDDSGDDDDDQQDDDQEEAEKDEDERIMAPFEEQRSSSSFDVDYVALKSFRPDPTHPETIEREKNLQENGLLFTRDEYRHYIDNRIVSPPEDDEYFDRVRSILASIAEKEKRWAAGTYNKRPQSQELELESTKRMRSASPVAPEASTEDTSEPDDTSSVDSESSSSGSSTTNSIKSEDVTPPIPASTAPSKSTNRPSPPLAILDTLLSNLLRDSQSTQKSKTGELSDLEAAAMAAELDLNTADPSNAAANNGPQSKLSKQQHLEFLNYNEMLKNGKELKLHEKNTFDALCVLVKSEKEQFLRYQCKSVIESGAYDTLDPKVDKLVHEFYELEKKRVHAYQQFYKYFNIVEMSPSATNDPPILAFKKCLFTQGQIAPCNPKMYDSPRNMNLFRRYLVNNANSPDEEEEHMQYYKKKLVPAIILDPIIPGLMKDIRPDVVVSAECLTALVEMIHSISSDICIPISVMHSDADKKILVMDRPLPRESLTCRAKNKLVYDLAFKSLCLDWKKKHPISANQSRPPSPNSAQAVDKVDHDWDMESDENLQYNLWSFGDMNIIIRHQADGDLVGGTKERRVCLTTKLDYQIQPDGFEEISTPSERASQWIQSYIGGHAFILEGRIDVLKNRLVRVDQKQMKDIMSDNWKPSYESEMIRHTFLRLQKMLIPGNYLLQHKAGDRNFLIYQGTDKLENVSSGVDLYAKYDVSALPVGSNAEAAFVPAWNMKNPSKEQIPWTFPASSI